MFLKKEKINSGNWSASATWGGAGVPGNGDTWTVSAGHTVTYDITFIVDPGNIKNSSGKNIDCFYTIFAERIDVDKLEVEYADKN